MGQGSVTVADRARDDPLDRRTHDYGVDFLLHHGFFDHYDKHPDLDDAIVLADFPYFYTPQNTGIEEIKKKGHPSESPRDIYGREKGDLDIAVIFLDDREVHHYELKSTDDIPSQGEAAKTEAVSRHSGQYGAMGDYWELPGLQLNDIEMERAEQLMAGHCPSSGEEVDLGRKYSAAEQVERLADTFSFLEKAGADWEYTGVIKYLDDSVPDTGCGEHPDRYRGEVLMSSEVEDRARNMEDFQKLNEIVFDGRFFTHGDSISVKRRIEEEAW